MSNIDDELFSNHKNLFMNTTFSEALQALLKGRKICRSGWNGKGMWLLYVPESAYFITSNLAPFPHLDELGVFTNAAFIGMKTVDGKFVPWLASQTDILANDWQVID